MLSSIKMVSTREQIKIEKVHTLFSSQHFILQACRQYFDQQDLLAVSKHFFQVWLAITQSLSPDGQRAGTINTSRNKRQYKKYTIYKNCISWPTEFHKKYHNILSYKYENCFCPHWTIVLDNKFEFMIRHLSKQFCQVGVFKGIFLVKCRFYKLCIFNVSVFLRDLCGALEASDWTVPALCSTGDNDLIATHTCKMFPCYCTLPEEDLVDQNVVCVCKRKYWELNSEQAFILMQLSHFFVLHLCILYISPGCVHTTFSPLIKTTCHGCFPLQVVWSLIGHYY